MIWTVAIVSHPVVADHHRHHSLELVQVEAPVMEIAVVIAHAMHFRLLLFLSHKQMEELGAILVAVQADLAVHEVQEVALRSSFLGVRLPAPRNWCRECKESREMIKVTQQITQSRCCCCCCCYDCQAFLTAVFGAGRGVESLSNKVRFPF